MDDKFLKLEKDPHQPANLFTVVTLLLAGVALWLLPFELVVAIARYVVIVGILTFIADAFRKAFYK